MTENYGEMIARVRREHDWTQADLAEKSGVPQRTIQEIEAGRTDRPQRSTRTALNLALDIEGVAADERATWPIEVQVFLDIMGAFLTTMDETERVRMISGITHWVATRRRKL